MRSRRKSFLFFLADMWSLTEKFEQAISDYEAGVVLKSSLLPVSSRQIAEAHYKLSIVLDLTSGRLAQAITHAEKALISVESRLAELRNALGGQVSAKPELKGKAKAPAAAAPVGKLLVKDDVAGLSKSQMEAEMKGLEGLREDWELKVCYSRLSFVLSLISVYRSRS